MRVKDVLNFQKTVIMKKIALYMLGAAVALTSCNDLLDGDPYDEFTKDNFFTSETNVQQFANYFYSEFSGYGNSGSYGNFYFNNLNDDQGTTGLATWTFTNTPATAAAWNTPYTEIRRANTLLNAIPSISSMNEEKKKNWEGIARLYRGYQHFKLVRAYGDCYWVEDELDSSNEDILFGQRQPRNTVMDKVLEDLNFAVANIKDNESSHTAFNVWVAQAMKAEVCLFEGTYCKYVTKDTNRANTWLAEAKKACEAIMISGKFTLNPDFQANFNSLDLGKNPEMIMYKHYVYGVLGHSTIDYTCGSTQVNGMSKDAFDSYLFLDGKPLATTSLDTDDKGEIVLKADSSGIKPAAHINIAKVLKNRDPRLTAHVDSILQFPGCGWARFGGAQSTASTGYGVNLFDTPLAADYKNSEGDAITEKKIDKLFDENGQLKKGYYYDNSKRQSIGSNETDAPIFWLAEILLDYAEACAEMGSCTNEDLNKSINLLRERVGMPKLTVDVEADPANNMGVSNLIWEIRRERRVELMYCQNDRYYSLQRWNQLELLDTQKHPNIARGANVGFAKDNVNLSGVKVDADGYINCTNGNKRTYDSKYILFPIPTGQITLNPQMSQNAGW